MFTADELDAIVVGARLVRRLRDSGLQRAADSVLAKVAGALPDTLRPGLTDPPFFVSEGSTATPDGIALSDLRAAIRDRRKVRISYVDATGFRSDRTVWPLAMAYYVDSNVIGAWCELRTDLRNFRADRIIASIVLDEQFPQDEGRLLERWFRQQATARSGRDRETGDT
jgi:predicted DNA-binding transcriptional regulator YafY